MSRTNIRDIINQEVLYFPKILLYGENYKHLSGNALKLYILLNDKLEESLENNWVDEHNHMYFIFTDEELSIIFNSSVEEVLNAKKELEDFGLLLQIKQENGANKLYLETPEVSQKDINLYKNN